MFYKAFSIFLLTITLTACNELPYNNLDNKQLKTLLDNGTPIFDVRRPDEWRQTGVINNSKLLTFVNGSGKLNPEFLPRFTSMVSKDDPVILVCRTGNRTSQLARYLVEELGYTNVHNVKNGITQWIRDKQPVKRL
ncbi:MAG: rhodanese-like domain-containing protein [Gammaproteobacteria bacterium]|nr:rhodanese-like domain-containing protein [Gammaproteobacteria bacterium]MDH5659669.1 rhodanese-like domain-containing protein [Gammaproteobacteria bacterium]